MDSKYFSDLLDDLKIIFNICTMLDEERKHIILAYDNSGTTAVGTDLINKVYRLNNKIVEFEKFKKEIEEIDYLAANRLYCDGLQDTEVGSSIAFTIRTMINEINDLESQNEDNNKKINDLQKVVEDLTLENQSLLYIKNEVDRPKFNLEQTVVIIGSKVCGSIVEIHRDFYSRGFVYSVLISQKDINCGAGNATLKLNGSKLAPFSVDGYYDEVEYE
jgi:hypothetical protein